MKQFLPSVALKIALNVQSGASRETRKKREACWVVRERRKGKRRSTGSWGRRKKWGTECRALATGGGRRREESGRGTRLFISEKGCKDCSRATTLPRPTCCSQQTRGRITAIIIRLMPCKLSGRERPFAWFYAHFSANAWSLSTSRDYRRSGARRSQWAFSGLQWDLSGFPLHLQLHEQS